jgi:quercetin dioxygenase-like cupin family protein
MSPRDHNRTAEVEAGIHEPSVQTLARFLAGTGHRLLAIPTASRPAAEAAEAVSVWLRAGDEEGAFREVLQLSDDLDREPISLDVLLPLATALQVDLDALLDVHSDDDVVIRPTPSSSGQRTTWMLSRPTGSTIAVKMRIEPTRRTPEPRVHPGHDWCFLIEGRVRLSLGEREITVETGEAAEFATMTPHALAAIDGPAELIMVFDRESQRAHVHHEPDRNP